MKTLTDQELLGRYASGRCEAAFEELARRHVDVTYSTALRSVGDPQRAEDVTQAVFVALAQNAAQLAEHPVLYAWLHRAARNVGAQTVRAEVRRRSRELQAATMNEMPCASMEPSWVQLAPHLDSALAELDNVDRDAILLRYFEGKSAREIGDRLGISAEAAQKRVSRAVEQLRGMFAKRDIAIGAGALAVLLSVNAVQAAPVGLAGHVSSAATLAGTATASCAVVPGLSSTALAMAKVSGGRVFGKLVASGWGRAL